MNYRRTIVANLKWQEDRLILSGELSFANAMAIYEESLLELKNKKSFIFDFREVSASNSVGLALMIEWIKLAQKHGKPIQFINIPQDLSALAKAARLDALLG